MLAKPPSSVSKNASNLIGKPTSTKELATENTSKSLPLIEEFCKKKEKNTDRTSSKKDVQSVKKLSLPDLKLNQSSPQKLGGGESLDECNAPWHSLMIEEPYKMSAIKAIKRHGDADFNPQKKELGYGLSECQVQFKTTPSEFQLRDLGTEDKEPTPSNALKRWQVWVDDKKRMQNYLSKKIQKDPCSLQMQESEKYRQIKEQKLLFEYAQIPTSGNWKKKKDAESKLRKKQVKDSENLPGKKFQSEKGEIPQMEFIGMSKSIKKEKGFVCDMKSNALVQWEKMPYRKERQLYFKDQMEVLKPHDVQMDDLEVIGKKISQTPEEAEEKPKTFKNIPKIKITSDDSKNCSEERKSIFYLVINGEEIKCDLGCDCQDRCKMLTWNLDFGVNPVKTFAKKVLVVENRGTMAVKYNWEPYKSHKNISLHTILSANNEQWFYFNKNSGIFLPGQFYEFQFYLFARSAGVRKEIWNLNTAPHISKNVVVFSAVAVDNIYEENPLELFLCRREKESIVNFIIEVMIFKVFTITDGLHEIEYRSLFDEKSLFEYHNPKCYYDSVIVQKLKGLLEKIPDSTQQEWDLSLNSLASIIQTYTKGKEKDSLLSQVAMYSKKLLRPNYVFVKNEKEYKLTYEILCKMANLIEEDYECMKKIFFTKTNKEESEESEEFCSNFSLNVEETGEVDNNLGLFDCSVPDFFFFKTIFYIKVYNRICGAVDQISGAFETNKLFKPWKQVNRNPKTPLVMSHLYDPKK